MQRIAGLTVILLPAALSAQTKDGFVPLFNGMDLDGWEVRESNTGDKEKWSFKNNLLVAKPGGGWIGTKKMYGDFVLKLEWKIFDGGNSGVFLRVPDVKSKESPSALGTLNSALCAVNSDALSCSGPRPLSLQRLDHHVAKLDAAIMVL